METMRIVTLRGLESAGQDVRVCGWVRTRRDTKACTFIEVNDGSCLSNVQVVVDPGVDGYDTVVRHLATGASVRIDGVVVDSPGSGQVYELHARAVTLLGDAPPDYPLQKKRHTFEYLRQIPHLRPRTNALGAVTRVRSTLSYAVHTFFQERGFACVHTPIITASDCEGAGSMFRVTTLDADKPSRRPDGEVDFSQDFFGQKAFLTVSGQLEGEAYATALGRIYTFGPTFRAENSNTPRHLAEFWMIEPEAAFFELSDDMDLAESFVRYLADTALKRCGEELALFNDRIDNTVISTLETIVKEPFARISYTEAVDILQKNNPAFAYPVVWGTDIQTEHERYLSETVFGRPVIVHDYPKEIKAFYMKLNDDGRTVRAMDLLVPRIGELIGGSEREDRLDVLTLRMGEAGLDPNHYAWYSDLRRYGSVPHAGFGLGFERLLLLVTGMQNIRDVIAFPRTPGNAEG